jgi:opacity protein-like surface antigen
MRLRLCVLPAISLAMVCLPAAAYADEPGLVRLRGSSVYTAPTYPLSSSEPLYQEPAPPPRPAAPRPARPVAPARPAAQLHGFTFEFGARYWYSTGKLAKDLYDDPRSSQNLNSRLTYSGLSSGSLEGFGRADTTFGSFIRGFAGFSGLNRGALNDEDFPPALSPYSNTLSQQQGGKLTYGSIDFGQIVVQNERVRASVFVGYGYLNESVSAFGCNQIAGNPFVCAPAIGPGVLAITENSSWQFARLGVLAEFKVLDRLKLSAEVAWLPYEQITAQDTHWLRLGSGLFDISGPIPENGGGTGVQLEAIASYAVSDNVTVGLGARYWYLQTRGSTDFENVIVGFPAAPVPQPLNFSTTRYGGFAQGAYRFGPI